MPEHYISVFVERDPLPNPPLEQQKPPDAPDFLDRLNDHGLIAYHIKCLNALIEYFGYDYEDWREVMELLTDWTWLVNTFEKEHGLVAKSEYDCSTRVWNYAPSEILKPIGIPQKGTDKYIFPCDICGQAKYQFEAFGADNGLCMNMGSCRYVKENYRYHGGGKYGRGEGIYKRNYELYLKTDFNFLRALNNALTREDELTELFDEGRIVLLWDTLKIFYSLGLPYPDAEGIHEYAFGEDSITKRFSTRNLLKPKKGE